MRLALARRRGMVLPMPGGSARPERPGGVRAWPPLTTGAGGDGPRGRRATATAPGRHRARPRASARSGRCALDGQGQCRAERPAARAAPSARAAPCLQGQEHCAHRLAHPVGQRTVATPGGPPAPSSRGDSGWARPRVCLQHRAALPPPPSRGRVLDDLIAPALRRICRPRWGGRACAQKAPCPRLLEDVQPCGLPETADGLAMPPSC